MFTQLRQCSGLIALGFVLSLVAGCAQPGSDPSSESVGKSPIKIGQIVDLSGPSADLGKYEQMGAELFAEQINANGGLLGRQLQIVSRDGKGATADAINQAKDLLYGQNVDFIMTGSNSGYAMAISDLARQSKKLMLSQNANDEYTLQKGHPYAFRIPNIIARTQARSAAEYAAKQFPQKKKYYLMAHDYAFGRTVIEDFKTDIKAAVPDVEFVGESYVKTTETDYNSYITAILQAKPDVLFFAWQVGVPFFKQAAPYQLSQKVQMLSAYWGGVQDMMSLSREDLPVGAVVGGIPFYGVGTSQNDSFVQAFQEKYKLPPKPSAYFDYISLETLAQAVKKAGSTETDKVAQAMAGLEASTVLGNVKVGPQSRQGATPYWLGAVKWDEQLKMGVITQIVRMETNSFLPSDSELETMRKRK